MSSGITEYKVHIFKSLHNKSALVSSPREHWLTFPRVSGTKKYVNAKARRQNAAKKIYVPQVIFSSISGVTRPMILRSISHLFNAWSEQLSDYKLHIHVVEVVMEIALDLIERLKISDGSTQPIGARMMVSFLWYYQKVPDWFYVPKE